MKSWPISFGKPIVIAGLLAGLQTLSISTMADGWVNFSNRIPGLVEARVSHAFLPDTYVDGSFLTQLLAGKSPEKLEPVGTPRPFRSNSVAATGYFVGEAVLVPTVDDVPGGRTFVQMVAWSRRQGGTNYPQFVRHRRCGAFIEWGASEVFENATEPPEVTNKASPLIGLRPFSVSLPLSPGDAFLSVKLTQPETIEGQYFLAQSAENHVLEKSANFVEWQPVLYFTNQEVRFIIHFTITNREPIGFFRMQRLGCD